MKLNRTSKLIRGFAMAVGAYTALASVAQAASFTYNIGDLILGFRESGQPDVVVDIGQASVYDAVLPGDTITITGLPALLNAVYPSLDSLNWSVAGSERLIGASYPFQTVWATAPRSDVGTQSTPWIRLGQFSQASPASQIAAIGNNAATYSSVQPASSTNTATFVVIPNNNPNAYTPLIEDPYTNVVSDITGTFQGSVENTTPFDFDSGEPLSVSDLYELQPGSGPGKWVGYFSFTSDGNVVFTAAVATAPAPHITAITRNGNVTSVSFTTSANYTYSLLVTNQSGFNTPRSTWPVSGGSITGTGGVLTLNDTNSTGTAYYAITAH